MPARKQQARRRIIIAQLCELSRNGWRNARPCDYLPLEAELRRLEERPSMAAKQAFIGKIFVGTD